MTLVPRYTNWVGAKLQLNRYSAGFLYIFNFHTILLGLVSCLCVYLCDKHNFSYKIEFSLVGLAVTFPVTFAIGQQFLRRERALTVVGDLKACVVALYWQHRDWAQDTGSYPDSIGDDTHPWAREIANVLIDFLDSLEKYITSRDDGYESIAEVRIAARAPRPLSTFMGTIDLHHGDLRESFIHRLDDIMSHLPSHKYLMRCYACLSRLSVCDQYLTYKARYSRGGEGGLATTGLFLHQLIGQMEQLRSIKLYRTPAMLRYSCSVLVYLGAVALAPYFVQLAQCNGEWVERHTCPAPYVMVWIYVIITMLLLNVQASAENPFDMSGMDDVFIDLAKEFSDITAIEDRVTLPPIDDDGACFAEAAAAAAAAAKRNSQQEAS